MGLLMAQATRLMHQAQPNPLLTELNYAAGRWCLHETTGEVSEYTQTAIRYDVGLFLQIELMVPDKRSRRLIIFQDQLSTTQRQVLYLLQLPHFKSDARCVKMTD
jgi:hypothetical protein